jgi:hypothetical protein
MNIFSALTQFDFVNVIRRRNETASPEEGLVSVGLLGGESGTFTPTISNITPSAVTVPTVSDMIYQRVGNVVTCSFYFEILFDGETSVNFNFSLPIASNFNAPSDLIGSISKDVADGDTWVTVSANDSLNLGSINVVTVAQNNFYSYVTFQYIILP